MQKIFSPGKLLLTSEYFVLDGALALAVPTQLGQVFFYEERNDHQHLVIWEAKHLEKNWLRVVIDYQNWTIIETNLKDAGEFVWKVLKQVQLLSSEKLQGSESYFIQTNLEFPANFGLGSSSTLMNNLSEWANVDAFLLNEKCLGGSGYDIAIAQKKSAILYQTKPMRMVEKVHFNPSFKNEIIFIHLNQKQDSRAGIKHYRSLGKKESLIQDFSEITQRVLTTDDISTFSSLMTAHENKIAEALNLTTVKENFFADYGGFVKSLGAWGGDFVMASKLDDYQAYFQQKGFSSIFEWRDLIV